MIHQSIKRNIIFATATSPSRYHIFKIDFINLKKITNGKVGNDAISSASDRFFYLSDVNLNYGDNGYSWGLDYNNYTNQEDATYLLTSANAGFGTINLEDLI